MTENIGAVLERSRENPITDSQRASMPTNSIVDSLKRNSGANSKLLIDQLMLQAVSGVESKKQGIVKPTGGKKADKYAKVAKNVLRDTIETTRRNPNKSMQKINKSLGGGLGMLAVNQWGSNPWQSVSKQLSSVIGKSISLTSPISSGLVPYDLTALARIIAPFFTPFRNKVPRTPGQGTYHEGKIISTMSGSQPGIYGNMMNDATTEFFGGSIGTWPNALPPSGSQNGYDIRIPYKFYAITENASWLAQFAGEGFDDAFGLAKLILVLEAMLLEEHDIYASTSIALTVPQISIAARAAGSNELPLTGVTTNVYVEASAVNYWGETIPGTSQSVAFTTGDVVDVTITTPTPGAMGYRFYVTNGASPGTYYQWSYNMAAGNVTGAYKFTLQGALPTSGPVPQVTDSGTFSPDNAESILSVITGHASSGLVYPKNADGSLIEGGYVQQSSGQVLDVDTLNTALKGIYNSSSNSFFANPAEIICAPDGAVTLSESIIEANSGYLLTVQQSQVSGVTAGAAVSNMVNPITRSLPEILPYPYSAPGTAVLMSYTLPQTQQNLGNVVEIPVVQDLAVIDWPVIDPVLRSTALRYSTFYMPAPQYCGIIQGLQNSATTPYS